MCKNWLENDLLYGTRDATHPLPQGDYVKKNIENLKELFMSPSQVAVHPQQTHHWQSTISSDQSLSPVRLFATPWTQHARPPCPAPTPGVYSNSCPLSLWGHQAISSSVIPFSSCLQSFPASGSFQMSQFFTSGGQSIGVSASSSVLPTNIQNGFG